MSRGSHPGKGGKAGSAVWAREGGQAEAPPPTLRAADDDDRHVLTSTSRPCFTLP